MTATARTPNASTSTSTTTVIGKVVRPEGARFTRRSVRAQVRALCKDLFPTFGLSFESRRDGVFHGVARDGEVTFALTVEMKDEGAITADLTRNEAIRLVHKSRKKAEARAAAQDAAKAEKAATKAAKAAAREAAKAEKAKAPAPVAPAAPAAPAPGASAAHAAALVALGRTPAQIGAIRGLMGGVAPAVDTTDTLTEVTPAAPAAPKAETGLERNRRLRREVKALGLTVADNRTATLEAAIARESGVALDGSHIDETGVDGLVESDLAELDEDVSRPDTSFLDEVAPAPAPKAKAATATLDEAEDELGEFDFADFGTMGF